MIIENSPSSDDVTTILANTELDVESGRLSPEELEEHRSLGKRIKEKLGKSQNDRYEEEEDEESDDNNTVDEKNDGFDKDTFYKTIINKSSGGFEWVNIKVKRTDKSRWEQFIKDIGHEYNLKHQLLKNCFTPKLIPKIEITKNGMFIMTRYAEDKVDFREDSIGAITSKIVIFTDQNRIITIHRAEPGFLHHMQKQWEKIYFKYAKDHLLNFMLDRIIKTYENQLTIAVEEMDNYELKIFSNQRDIIQNLYHIKRRASVFKRMLKLTREVIVKYNKNSSDQTYSSDVLEYIDGTFFVSEEVHENSMNLMNLYMTLSSHKTNELMTVLTVFSAYFIPLTFIAGVYGMNFEYMPELHWEPAYPVLVGVMAFIIIVVTILFAMKGIISMPFDFKPVASALYNAQVKAGLKPKQVKLEHDD